MPNTDHNNRERKQQQPDDPPESPKSDYFKVNNGGNPEVLYMQAPFRIRLH